LCHNKIKIMKKEFNDWLKANRKGSRDAELENETGWVAVKKAHKTLKDYSRKGKNKFHIEEY